MSKITGNECIGGHFFGSDATAFSISEPGIPIRLYLAAVFASHQNSIILTPQDAAYLLQKADALIAAYNSTPNPNAP